MNPLRVARARLVGVIRKTQLDAELDDEIRFHLAMRAQENVARGMAEAEARREATRRFGNVARLKDECRDVSGGGLLEVLWQDVRFATRMLLKNRGFTAIAVLALALGIGANTALFTVMRSVVLRPLPFPQQERIMSIWTHKPGAPQHSMAWAYPDFADVRAQNSTFEAIGGYRPGRFVISSDGSESTAVDGAIVSSDVFRILGIDAAVGRIFKQADDQLGSRSVVISDQLWQERFGRSATITDARLTIDGESYRIIGVMPAEFRFPVQNNAAQIWITLARDLTPFPNGNPSAITRRDAHCLAMLGRLRDSVTLADATADLRAITGRLAEQHPDTNRPFETCSMAPWLTDLTRHVRPILFMLIGAALCVLGIACANVANLLLARASTRQKEIAVRSALGAGRGRILRQLLTESLLLAAAGGIAGLVLALIATPTIVALLPAKFPRAIEIAPDLSVLAFTAIITVVTSSFFGFAPSWRSARCELARVLNDCSRNSADMPHGRRTRNALVIAEMVLAFLLLTSAVFLIRNLWRLQQDPLGFNSHGLLTVQLAMPIQDNAEAPSRVVAGYRELIAKLEGTPGVSAVSAVSPLPVSGFFGIVDYGIRGRALAKPELPLSEPHIVLPNFFRTMEIPLKAGRDFDDHDARDAAPVVIINEALARASFPAENPIGKYITPGMADSGVVAEREIIGVVADVKCDSLASEPKPEVYLPHPQCVSLDLALVLRGDLSASELDRLLRRTAADLELPVAISPAREMDDYIDAAVAQPRLNSTLLAAFALVSVVITAIGVYGVMSYSVAQRRHEIGIRLALGAQKLAVFRLVLGEAIRLIGWSLLAGSVCSLLLGPVLRRFAYGAGADQVSTIGFVALLVAVTGLLACWVPAKHAASEDPLVAIGQR